MHLVERIQMVDVGTEEEHDALIERFATAVPHPAATDLIFWPQTHGFDYDPSPEEIVDAALAYRPMEMGPASD